MKLTKQNYTKEFIEQRIADQRAYIAKLEQKPNRDEVWESAIDTLAMWVTESKNTFKKEFYVLNLMTDELEKLKQDITFREYKGFEMCMKIFMKNYLGIKDYEQRNNTTN